MRRRWATVLLAAASFAFAQEKPAAVEGPAAGMPELLKRFVDVYSIMETESAEPINSEQAVYQGAIPGLLRRLDPHSIFFDPDQFEQLKQLECMQQETQQETERMLSQASEHIQHLQWQLAQARQSS